MATIEERLALLEQEHTELKKALELQTIAIGALVNKATLERLNEKYDKIFDALISHDRLTNERLADLQTQVIEVDGKVVGVQTEMRQGFNAVNARFEGVDARFNTIDARLDRIDARFDQIMPLLTALVHKPEQESNSPGDQATDNG